MEQLNHILPPKVESESGIVMTGKESIFEAQKWFSEMDEAIAEAKRTGKPIFLSFSGYTCTNCHWMDANILSKTEVKKFVGIICFGEIIY